MSANRPVNIVVPMAGRGSRFSKAGYELPKPLLFVHGRPMIEVVIDNIRPSSPHRFIFICQREHLERYALTQSLSYAGPDTVIIPIDGVTEGAACTVMLAEAWINNENPLMIANCDQYISTPIDEYLDAMTNGDYDGFIMTMKANDPKWSFVRLGSEGEVTEVVEKKVVSDEATVGIYNFRKGSDFVAAAGRMIAHGDRTNSEFYVAPAYNYLPKGARLGYMNIGSERDGMYGLGIPEDLTYFNGLTELPRATHAACAA
ncbi:MAG TPA: glycosyltransferase family 2 protein [Aquabacterium sp.]|nr:glycosyltransferase family 2 protein [Aquabacterium sp.]